VEDVSERKRLAADRLEEIKVAEVTRWLGEIGHDVKNMLMPVLTGVDLLREEVQEMLGRLAARGEGAQAESVQARESSLRARFLIASTMRTFSRIA
jgi:hypothetical protein